VVPAAAAALLLIGSSEWSIAAVFLLATAAHHMVHTVADDFRHRALPSASRATASSALNLLESLAGLGSAALLGWLLGLVSPATAAAIMGIATLPAVVCLLATAKTEDKLT
jgi:hypothetical protein